MDRYECIARVMESNQSSQELKRFALEALFKEGCQQVPAADKPLGEAPNPATNPAAISASDEAIEMCLTDIGKLTQELEELKKSFDVWQTSTNQRLESWQNEQSAKTDFLADSIGKLANEVKATGIGTTMQEEHPMTEEEKAAIIDAATAAAKASVKEEISKLQEATKGAGMAAPKAHEGAAMASAPPSKQIDGFALDDEEEAQNKKWREEQIANYNASKKGSPGKAASVPEPESKLRKPTFEEHIYASFKLDMRELPPRTLPVSDDNPLLAEEDHGIKEIGDITLEQLNEMARDSKFPNYIRTASDFKKTKQKASAKPINGAVVSSEIIKSSCSLTDEELEKTMDKLYAEMNAEKDEAKKAIIRAEGRHYMMEYRKRHPSPAAA